MSYMAKMVYMPYVSYDHNAIAMVNMGGQQKNSKITINRANLVHQMRCYGIFQELAIHCNVSHY